MKTYMRKVGKTLLFGLVILAIAVVIYLVVPKYQTIPKYQIYTIRVDYDVADVYDRVLVIKLNTITGETNRSYEQYKPYSPGIKINKISPIR